MKSYLGTPKEIVDRVFQNIDIGENDECWNWTRRVNKNGKPVYTLEKYVDGKRSVTSIMVQHLMYEFHKEMRSAKIIDTTCGNKLCCNPAHLKPRDFVARINNYEVLSNGCWKWLGNVFSETGYGHITIDGKSKLVHRVSWEYHNNQEIPESLMILHSKECVTRLCINPAHLRLGTHDENMRDMTEIHHAAKGEGNAKAILTESQVIEIKQKIKSRLITYQNIANEYGVSRQAIKDIALGRTWKWL